MVVIALTKGRILKQAVPFLESIGIAIEKDFADSRKLIFKTNQPNIQCILLRGVDVPTYVQMGIADIGIVGKDILLEQQLPGIYEQIDLGICRCRLVTATLKNYTRPSGRRIKVATKYSNIARQFYAEQGVQIDLIKLYGAMELAPILHLSDEIVDIVDTGDTLKANGLEMRQPIADISSRLIVNHASMKFNYKAISTIVDQLNQVTPSSPNS